MFRLISSKMAFLLAKGKAAGGADHNIEEDRFQIKLSKKLSDNIKTVKEMTGNSGDVVIRKFSFGRHQNINAALIYIDGMSDIKIINKNIIEPLMYKTDLPDTMFKGNIIDQLETDILSVSEVERAGTFGDTADGFLNGDAALMVDGQDQALLIGCKSWEKRTVSEPASESVIRGPRESFTENLRTNTTLIRRKIKDPALTVEKLKMGRRTRTNVCVIYIDGLADKELIQMVKERLSAVDTDSILESGYIEQYIEDSPFSIFATIRNTEKPDVVAANLLEGRVAIAVDGTPFVLTVPFLFIESFQTAEDYYFRPYYMNILRMVRYLSYALTVTAPAIYVAITTYHQELIPTSLLFTMARAREGIPLPAFVESLIMLITFEILREAGIRLPSPIGQAMSIVGALVIGEASVSAGIIGAPMVIVISITAVSVFAITSQADSAAVLRIILLVLGATMGGFGITIGIIGTLVHLASLESFGVPYLSPIAPFSPEGSKDSLIRAPLWTMLKRPRGMARQDRKRRDFSVPPAGKNDGENNKWV